MRQFHKPVKRPSDIIEEFDGTGDPAEASTVAHDTAAVLVRLSGDKAAPAIRVRLLEYIAQEGVEDLLELWAQAPAVSLPGALAHLRKVERQLPEGPVAEEVRAVLVGKYDGDFGDLCERAAIACRRLGPRWDQRAADLEACAKSWYADKLW
jgi:hypothetical protein